MPEPEELFIDAARHATVAARGLWRRWRPERDGTPCWLLEDCKPRLALLVESILGLQLPIRVAQAPAPLSWTARWLRRVAAEPAIPLPANDGTSIYLPPRLGLIGDARGESNRNDYPLLALLQGQRCLRGSARFRHACDNALAEDLYLLAEAHAADRALRRLLPGWRTSLDALYARQVAALAQTSPRDAAGRTVMRLYRALLVQSDKQCIPSTRTPSESVDWANDTARGVATDAERKRYRQWLADPVTGRLLRPEAMPVQPKHSGTPMATDPARQMRQATLARRPRARESEPDEDDAPPGPWMVQTSEPHEHAEDPLGFNRPQDRDIDRDMEGDAQSVAELESARLVSTPGRSTQVLCSTDPPPRMETGTQDGSACHGFVYPEWDCRIGAYAAQTRVCVTGGAQGSQAWVDATLERHAATLREIRRRLGAIRPARQVLRRQTEGDDIDFDALVDERSEAHAGGSPAGALYQQQRPAQRRIGLLLVIDASASTDAWVGDNQRAIDVEKEAALVAASALDMARAEFSIVSFSGEGPACIEVKIIKEFDEPWNGTVMRRIAAIEPDRYTRLGGALRHACALLASRTVDYRLLLLLSDGKPNDCDRYASAYGLEDARQALIEARVQQVEPYCFTVDREGSGYLPHLFGRGNYTVVQHPQQLPFAFIEWLQRTARHAIR